jgi:integrase
MASIQPRGSRWQLRVVHKLLPKPFFSTFDSEAEAKTYGATLEGLLDRGMVPAELLVQDQTRTDNTRLAKIIKQYLADSNIAPSDRPVLDLVSRSEGNTKLSEVNATWADLWVGRMKVTDHLAPSTIRKRVEVLARAIDWHHRRRGQAAVNPLRQMPRGYASPTKAEVTQLSKAGLKPKRDTERNRRLDAAELVRVRDALAGKVRTDRQRAWGEDAGFALLFELILATGMRLSEAYRLRVDQIDMVRWVIKVEGSKGHRGATKPRVVPMVKPLRPLMQKWCKARVGRVFDLWDGTPEDKPRCTMRLSARFATLFAYAQVLDCTEHDLRHCATCDWFELRDAAGRWVFSEIEVCRIMGWADTRMALRYASMRGEDLAARLG